MHKEYESTDKETENENDLDESLKKGKNFKTAIKDKGSTSDYKSNDDEQYESEKQNMVAITLNFDEKLMNKILGAILKNCDGQIVISSYDKFE